MGVTTKSLTFRQWLSSFDPDVAWCLFGILPFSMLIASGYAMCYNSIYEKNNSYFRVDAPIGGPSVSATLRQRDFVYFSVSVLLGGSPNDIVPNDPIVRLIMVSEMAVGICLLVLAVTLVGTMVRQQSDLSPPKAN